jgi:hypothetical protein
MYSWVSTEFCRHGIPSTRNSPVDMDKNTRNFVEFRGISRILRASLYNMYEFEYFKCKYLRIKSKI